MFSCGDQYYTRVLMIFDAFSPVLHTRFSVFSKKKRKKGATRTKRPTLGTAGLQTIKEATKDGQNVKLESLTQQVRARQSRVLGGTRERRF